MVPFHTPFKEPLKSLSFLFIFFSLFHLFCLTSFSHLYSAHPSLCFSLISTDLLMMASPGVKYHSIRIHGRQILVGNHHRIVNFYSLFRVYSNKKRGLLQSSRPHILSYQNSGERASLPHLYLFTIIRRLWHYPEG